jgi:hypothetical protein
VSDDRADVRTATGPRPDWAGLGAFFLFVPFSGLWLVPRAFVTLARVARAFWGRSARAAGRDFLAFTSVDAAFRGWYEKIACDLRESGRFGIVWDDGFGTPLGTRFYNNYATYRLYAALGPRLYAATSFAAFIASVMLAIGWRGDDWVLAAVVAVLIAASPLFIVSQIHLGKPEILWWFAVPWLVIACATRQFAVAGLLFSAIALVNFTVAFFAGITTVAAVVALLPQQEELLILGLAMAPGVLKTALRLVPFLRAGALRGLAREQADVVKGDSPRLAAKLRSALTPGFVLHIATFAVALLLTARGMPSPFLLIVAGVAAIVFLFNQSVLYVNDVQSFRMWHLSLLVAFAAGDPSWLAAAGLAVFTYVDPMFAGAGVPRVQLDRYEGLLRAVAARGREALTYLRTFPELGVVRRSVVAAPVLELFERVPDGARVAVELQTTDRMAGGFRVFLLACDHVLPKRGIEIVPDEYTRLTARFRDTVHLAFRASAHRDGVAAMFGTVGASYALALSPEMAAAMRRRGYVEAGALTRERIRDAGLDMPNDISLFATGANGQVTPAAPLTKRPNALEWQAVAGESYVVRYQYHRHLKATQNGRVLEVRPWLPFDGSDVAFVTVRAETDGPLLLRFAAGPLS